MLHSNALKAYEQVEQDFMVESANRHRLGGHQAAVDTEPYARGRKPSAARLAAVHQGTAVSIGPSPDTRLP